MHLQEYPNENFKLELQIVRESSCRLKSFEMKGLKQKCGLIPVK